MAAFMFTFKNFAENECLTVKNLKCLTMNSQLINPYCHSHLPKTRKRTEDDDPVLDFAPPSKLAKFTDVPSEAKESLPSRNFDGGVHKEACVNEELPRKWAFPRRARKDLRHASCGPHSSTVSYVALSEGCRARSNVCDYRLPGTVQSKQISSTATAKGDSQGSSASCYSSTARIGAVDKTRGIPQVDQADKSFPFSKYKNNVVPIFHPTRNVGMEIVQYKTLIEGSIIGLIKLGSKLRTLQPPRKIEADEAELDIAPPSKLAKFAMSGEAKENISRRNSDDDICIIEEVPRKWASPRARKGIKNASSGPHTSTPLDKTPSKGFRARGNASDYRHVDFTQPKPTSSTAAAKDSDDIQVISTIRHVPIERSPYQSSGAFGKTRPIPRVTQTPKKFITSSANKFKKSVVPMFNQIRNARTEMVQYKKLLERIIGPRNYNVFTMPNIKALEAPRKIDLVDLTLDVRANKSTERQPKTSASILALDKIENFDVKPVNSLSEYLKLHPTKFKEPSDIISQYEMKIKERKRLAEIEVTKLAVLSQHNRKVLNASLEERMKDYMKLSEPPVLEVEPDTVSYPELTEEQLAKVTNALRPSPPQEVLADKFGLKITRRDLNTLKGLNWLNDEVINFYMNLLMERGGDKVYAFNTFFYPKLLSGGHASLKRWTRKVDLFMYDFIFVPIHLGMHWCMCVVDKQSKEIRYYDSMMSPNERCLRAIMGYLKAESLDKRKSSFDDSGWEMLNVQEIPEQMNSSDCGVFACTFAEHIARDAPLKFTQDDMPYFRQKMVLEILEGSLIT